MIRFIKTEQAKYIEDREAEYFKINKDSLEGLSFTPTIADNGSSGFDLRACIKDAIDIKPDEVVKIPTGVKVWIGSDMYLTDADYMENRVLWAGLLVPRSSSKGLILNNTLGIIDNSYQGEIFCKFRNPTNETIRIEVGERFVQLVIVPTYVEAMVEVASFDAVTDRGEGGFGSTNEGSY
jgi:dUTP pyrophosphatase